MVIAYLRVGTSNKELLEEQKDEIERYASNHDMNVCLLYTSPSPRDRG